MRYRLPATLLDETFARLRSCGAGQRECQALWLSAWSAPEDLLSVAHPRHAADAVGFQVDDRWLSGFWLQLGQQGLGVRVQIHTHPGAAFHSATDDAFPILHKPGFLSLVIPRFATGPVGFSDAYLAEVQPNGRWRSVPITDRLELMP